MGEIKAIASNTDGNGRTPVGLQAAIQSTLSILTLIYGGGSHQVQDFIAWSKRGAGSSDVRTGSFEHRVAQGLGVVLDAALADFEAGLTTSVRVQAKGEVLGDFIALARESLEEVSDGSGRVAAVLAAAACGR